MYGKDINERYSEILPGIEIKTIVHGDATLMAKFRMKKGSSLPRHHHPYEQTGYLLEGKIKLVADGTEHVVGKNGSWCISANVEHFAEILEDAVALEIFSPVRPDYLKYFSVQDTY